MSTGILAANAGRGLEIAPSYAYLTAGASCSKGDVMQLVMSAGGTFASFVAPGNANAAFTGATYTAATNILSKTAAFTTVPGNSANQIILTGGGNTTYTDATKTIAETAAFAGYVFSGTNANSYVGDACLITGGTGATVGLYTVATRTSDDAITLATSIGAGADTQTDITGFVGPRDGRTRVRVTGGTGATAGVYISTMKISDDAIALDRDPAAGAPADIAFTLLDPALMYGMFCVAMDNYTSGQLTCRVMLRGIVRAYTKNSAGGGGAAIAAGNLYGAVSDKSLESNTITYGLGAKLIGKAIGTGTAAATNTRALRLVHFNGIEGFGNYGGIA